jgi:hypothetical protein
MDKTFLEQLNKFLGAASKATYAGDGAEIAPWRKGFHELEHTSGDWYYRDSYTGHFQSWGQETVWHKAKPAWTSLYGGGMVKKYHGDQEFADQTFNFLKTALSAGEKSESFQPRGPENLEEGDWKYSCKIDGDISKFQGSEIIFYKGEKVFAHDFIGGLVI